MLRFRDDVFCLAQAGIRAAAYHAGLKDPERSRVLADWSAGRIPVVAATIAFGMGIDRACEFFPVILLLCGWWAYPARRWSVLHV